MNKLQALLIDLTDKALRRRYAVGCHLCPWHVMDLEHERFAVARGDLHRFIAHAMVLVPKSMGRGYRVQQYRA